MAAAEIQDVCVDVRYSGGHQRRTCIAHQRIPRPREGGRAVHVPGTLDGSPYDFVLYRQVKDGQPAAYANLYFALDGQPYYFQTVNDIPPGVEVWTL